jgi:hypothetical protein
VSVDNLKKIIIMNNIQHEQCKDDIQVYLEEGERKRERYRGRREYN